MAYPETSFLLWSLGFIQIAGLVSAWLARLSEGSRSQASCQCLFLALLGLVGLSTMASLALGPRYWLACGATLSVMVLGAIWDFRAQVRTSGL
jgi:uncharacterized membrane protein